MSKYIDAEQFKRDNERLLHCDFPYLAEETLEELIDNALAADVQEVRHGRWILDENPHDGDCRCSVCGVAIDAMNERNHEMLNILTGGKWWAFYHYCPWCGAKMDEVEEDGRLL